MSTFTPGDIITRSNPLWDGDRPSWLRDNVLVRPAGAKLSQAWAKNWIWPLTNGFSLDASDIVYRCLAWNEAHPDWPTLFPNYGTDKIPDDWNEGAVLLRNGDTVSGEYARNPLSWLAECGDYGVIGYSRRSPTSHTETVEELSEQYLDALQRKADGEKPEGFKLTPIDGSDFHASGYAESIEESPEDFARAACKRAGMVAVKAMTESELTNLCADWIGNDDAPAMSFAAYLASRLGILRTPIDLACEAYSHIPRKDVEGIAAIVKGEGA
jgi:hypothetical protein